MKFCIISTGFVVCLLKLLHLYIQCIYIFFKSITHRITQCFIFKFLGILIQWYQLFDWVFLGIPLCECCWPYFPRHNNNRKNTSELIRQLITSCGHETTDNICDYVNRTAETAYRGMSSAPIGDGMRTALWQLSLALLFKVIITIFTFGIKVCIV